MTHFSVRRASTPEPAATTSIANRTAAVAPQSFMDELSRTFVEARSRYGIDPNPAKVTLGKASSQTIAGGQNSVASNSALTLASGLNALVPRTNPAVTPAPLSVPAASQPVQSVDDAYWAKQPAAVQQLRNIGDYNQRQDLAAQLASEGYSIDTPVMVWGWDPSKTTQLRQGFGYTWIPSAMQSPVTAAPGISGGGIVPYDPAHPPAGSIKV